MEVTMENLNLSQNNSIEDIIALYKKQMFCDGSRSSYYDGNTGHENHHQNGPTHINNPGTGWYETHTDSYFDK